MLNLLKKFGRYIKYLVLPDEKHLDEMIAEHAREKLIKDLENPGRLQLRDVEGNLFEEVVERSKIPNVHDVLGEYDGDLYEWEHQDDQIIPFAVVKGWLVDDHEWFMNYVKREGSMFHKYDYPLGAIPVKVLRSTLMHVGGIVQWSIIFDNARCFNVHWRGVSGMIMINHDDVESIVRDQVGIEPKDAEVEEEEFCICTFLQFKKEAINHLHLEPIHRPTNVYLPSNFAV